MPKLVAAAAVAVVLLLAILVTPTISPLQDAPMYFAAAHGYLADGLASQYPREPLYPLFLAAMEKLGLPLEKTLALVQNALFVAGLFFFMRSLTRSRGRSAEAWTAAAALTLIPTFFVTVNGSMYTESLSCTLIFLMLGSLVRVFTATVDDRSSHGATGAGVVGWAVVAVATSASLALIKGSFLYINGAFGFVAAVAAASSRAKGTRKLAMVASFLGVALLAWGATAMWLASRTPRLSTFERGGVVFFGHTEFAARFDFRAQTLPFLVNALSESACRRLYGGECTSYTFDAEDALGYSELARTNGHEQALFSRGLRQLFRHPLRQGAFALFELTRFVVHHGTTGFARLDAPVLGWVVSSLAVTVLLKLLNLLLYLVPPATLIVLRRRGLGWRNVWRDWSREMKFGIGLCLAYACLYLAVYGFATTTVRMVYPVAPLLILFDAQVIRTARSLLGTTAAPRGRSAAPAARAPGALSPDKPERNETG